MRFRVVLLLIAASLAAPAQTAMPVDKLVAFLRSAIQLKQDDRQVADYVRKIKLTNRLDARTVEELQGEGLGPKTVQALGDLRQASAGLPAAPPPAALPPPKPAMAPPSPAEQKRALNEATEYAMNYVKRLPDFICSQVTRRYVDPNGRESWLKQDEILERLSYFEQHEEYKVVTVNNKLTDIPHEKLGGSATSSGEFGSILKEIFDPRTETTFGWERWTTLRKRLTYVFNYHVPQAHSTYRITHYVNPASEEGAQSLVPGYRGLVYVDKESLKVMKITLEAENLPPGFPIRSVNLSLDYGPARIGDTDYVLPLQAELRSRGDNRFQVKNDIEFRMYRKFGTDTSIKFDTPAPLPEGELKEQPVK
jgi:hypothetical protein